MANTLLIDNQVIGTADTVETLYTSPAAGAGTLITAFTVSNNSLASASYKAYIHGSGVESVDAVVPLKIVVRDRFDSGPSIVNQVVPAGGTIRAENSTAGALSFYATGIEQ